MSNMILEGIKVLDLANENGVYCTKLLAELGAEVIKVEPPEGDSTRFIGPFTGNKKHVEKSLFHAFYNGGKKSITLDYKKSEGKELFLKLVKEADVLVETSKPGTMKKLGFDYDTLKTIRPELIMCSVTPFGQTGPYAQWNASSDIVPFAMSGPMYEMGVPGREPLQAGVNLAANLTGVLAVSGIISLISACAVDGIGDYIDMSIFDAAGSWRGEAGGVVQNQGIIPHRAGSQGMFVPMNYYPCKDGFVQLLGSNKWDELILWMKEQGIDTGRFDDSKYGGASYFNDALVAERTDVDALVTKLTMKYDKQDFMVEAQRRAIPTGASETPASVLKSPHYQARGLFLEVEHPEIGKYTTTSNPINFSESETRPGVRPPLLGEHNAEIYGKLNLSAAEINDLAEKSII